MSPFSFIFFFLFALGRSESYVHGTGSLLTFSLFTPAAWLRIPELQAHRYTRETVITQRRKREPLTVILVARINFHRWSASVLRHAYPSFPATFAAPATPNVGALVNAIKEPCAARRLFLNALSRIVVPSRSVAPAFPPDRNNNSRSLFRRSD